MRWSWLPRLCAAVVLGLVIPASAIAQTMVSGSIESDTNWTTAESPYVVSGELIVSNATLSIDAGVTIYMQGTAKVTVQSGSLQAVGTEAAPIRVQSDKVRLGQTPAAGDFGTWTFQAGAVSTRLEYVVFEHGSGIAVRGSSPLFNYVDVRNNHGAAISIDLAASPSGIGNRASGNSLDGIAVPAGDIVGSVKWGLRGIPYFVQSGTVSVGTSPAITTITPSTIERGQTITATVDGVRLTGLASASFDRNGLTATPFAGGTASRLSMQIKADATAELGQSALRLLVDAGEVVLPNALTVTQPLPSVSSISPTTVIAGSGVAAITVTGRNFTQQSEVLVNSATIPAEYVSETELRASLPNQTSAAQMPVQVRNPDPLSPGQYLVSTSSATLTVQMPVPPTVSFEPTPIAMPPDNKPHDILIRLSKADFRDHVLNLSVSDTSKASLNPTTLTIAAGQTTARVSITPLAQGSVTLTAQSSTLGEAKVPLFITQDFRGASTSYARPVGVVVEGGDIGTAYDSTVVQQGVVGVSIGSVLTGVAPSGWQVGSTRTFAIQGVAIPAGSQVVLVPADGISVGAVALSENGSTLTVPITAEADARIGPRQIVVRDPTGALLTFAGADASVVHLTSGSPHIDSVSPALAVPGSTITLVMRGRNLQGAKLQLLPGDGIEIDAQPLVNSDGTELRADIQVKSDAPLGDRIVRIATASGDSTEQAGPGNTLRIVSRFGPDYLTSAPMVGVIVGGPESPEEIAVPLLASNIGIVVGASVTEVSPNAGVIGTTTTVTVRGQGLQGVTSVAITPSTGLTLGTHAVNAEGTEITFSIDVAADATLGLRRLVLNTAMGPLAFADVMDGAFLISAPLALIDSVSPQVVHRGGVAQRITLRGQNFTNAAEIHFVPADGITTNSPFTISEDGTKLEAAIIVDAAATTGPRTVVLTTPAGESSNERAASNTLTVADQVGATYSAIATPLVGIMVGQAQGIAFDGTLASPLVGVTIETQPQQDAVDTHAIAPEIGVVIGATAISMTPEGILQGGSGALTVRGIGLNAITSVSAFPDDGVLLDQFTVNAEGTELVVPLSVAADAALDTRRLRLATATGDFVWRDAASSLFRIGKLPIMNSTSPILLDAGATTTLSIRGTNLSGVTSARLLPMNGVTIGAQPVWSQDSFGELLQVAVFIDLDAVPGDRVLQLIVPGGATTETPSAANTIKVVRP
ncbi:IPT/TIG domain-containing protein [Pseudoxanthomonas sp. UTMC 1351]|uniref:IPT/TIG domain-containing protein n=1 Tax=Pseudoxanthomonas sp. UTMC 1351 TaxID=2695853 RepID=UPI0034CDE797